MNVILFVSPILQLLRNSASHLKVLFPSELFRSPLFSRLYQLKSVSVACNSETLTDS